MPSAHVPRSSRRSSRLLVVERLESRQVPSFLPPVHTGVTNRYSLATGDLDHDGLMDLVAGAENDRTSSVIALHGDGAGRFTALSLPTTRLRGRHGVALADLNQDGLLDLAVINNGGQAVTVFAGNGDGTFQDRVEYATQEVTADLTVADLNGDDLPDMITANFRDQSISLLYGDGEGSFLPAEHVPVPGWPVHVRVADVNVDGVADLVVVNGTRPEFFVYLGNGDGTFQEPLEQPLPRAPLEIAVDDLNLDGLADLVMIDLNNTATALLGLGDGTFEPFWTAPIGPYSFSVATGDLNQDDVPDLVVASYSLGLIHVFLGLGDGTFSARQGFDVVGLPNSLVLVDLNADGYLDVVTADASCDFCGRRGGLSALFNDGEWGLGPHGDPGAPGDGGLLAALYAAALPSPRAAVVVHFTPERPPPVPAFGDRIPSRPAENAEMVGPQTLAVLSAAKGEYAFPVLVKELDWE